MSHGDAPIEFDRAGKSVDTRIRNEVRCADDVHQFIENLYPDAKIVVIGPWPFWEIDGDEGVLVHVARDSVDIRLPTIKWISSYQPEREAQEWRTLRYPDLTTRKLTSAIEAGRRRRRSEFEPCRFCGQRTPPEHRHDDVCHGCAEKHLGVRH